MTEPKIPESNLPAAHGLVPDGNIVQSLPTEAVQTDLAMTHCKGSIEKAAEVLEKTPKEIQAVINRYPALAAKWIRVRGKKLKTKNAFQGDLQVSEEQANKEVEEGLHKQRLMDLGLKEDEAKLALSMQNYHTVHQLNSMAILSGGLVKMGMEAMAMVGRLKQNPYEDEMTPDGMLVRSGRRETDAMILRALEAYGKKTLEYYNAESVRRKLSAVTGDGGKGKGKARFGAAPMRAQVLAQPGSNVTLISNPPQQHGETQESPDGQG